MTLNWVIDETWEKLVFFLLIAIPLLAAWGVAMVLLNKFIAYLAAKLMERWDP